MVNHKLAPLTESGALSAIAVVMALISVYVPVLGTVMAIIWPLPIIILSVRHGIRWGIMASIVSGVLIALLIEPMTAVRMVVAFAPVGLMLGFAYRKKYSAVKALISSVCVSIIAKSAVLLMVMFLMNINPLTMQVDMLKEAFEMSLDIYRGAGMSETQLTQMDTDFTKGLQLVTMLFPLIVILMGTLDAYVNFAVAGKVLRRLGHKDLPTLPVFEEWRLPRLLVYLYGFSLVGMYWGGTRELTVLYQISINANMLATFLGLIQGLALLQYAANRYQLSKLMRGIIIILILTNGAFIQILGFTGLFDILFDYRRRFTMKK